MRVIWALACTSMLSFSIPSFAECRSVLLAGEQLSSREKLCSRGGNAQASLENGKLKISVAGQVTWEAGNGSASALILGGNCQLDLYAGKERVWSTESGREVGSHCSVELEDNGELRLYRAQPIWDSVTGALPKCEIRGSRAAGLYSIYAGNDLIETTMVIENLPYYVARAVEGKHCRFTSETREQVQRFANELGSYVATRVYAQLEKYKLR